MELFDLTIIDPENTFCGIKIQQTWTALFMLEKLLVSENFDTIIELGTGHGALTKFFRMFALTFSYDIKFGHDLLDDDLVRGVIKNHIDVGGKTLVFCDNGNKEKEFEIYSRFSKKGDHILVHDYRRSDGFKQREVSPKGFKFFWQRDFDRLSTWLFSVVKR